MGGRYFNEKAYRNFDKILEKAEHIDTVVSRKDGKPRELYYRFKDGTKRNLYFKIAYEPSQGQKIYYYPYHIDTKLR